MNLKCIQNEITEQYLEDDSKIPWIIGFSGGKDSTMLLQLVWYALKEIPAGLRTRTVYVVSNNTLVENPKILRYTDHVLDLVKAAAMEQSLPVFVEKTTPQLEDTFWINLIGKGYPAPNSAFRWCTERLKITPTTEFIKRTISSIGQAIILLGTRKGESSNRAKSIERNQGSDASRLRRHPLPNAQVFAPITEVATQEVWQYLLQVPSPWGAVNRELVTLYNNATGGDCPLITDISTPSCGNSRFGCWVCTVVKRDKSMEALVDNGEEWMEPLLEFRDMLVDNRNNPDWRETKRRNNEDGIGPYTPAKRAYMLEVLLTAQKRVRESEPELTLINFQELIGIQITWHRDAIFNFSVAEIYNKVNGTQLSDEDFGDKIVFEKQLLKQACIGNPSDVKLIEELLDLQRTKIMMVKARGLSNDIENHLEKFIHSLN